MREEPTRRRFQYHKPDAEALRKRSEGLAGFDVYVKDTFKLWTPKVGDNTIRVFPATWEDPRPEHFGLDIFLHYNVGPDNSTYLCVSKMKDEACPVCEEVNRATREGEKDYADKLKAGRRVAYWIIDRSNEREGPQIWPAPPTFDGNLATLAQDPRTGEVIALDHPDEGYDVFFKRTGTGVQTKYEGLQIDRRPSRLGKEEWLDFVVSNPLPSVLNWYPYDHISSVFNGKSTRDRGSSSDERSSRQQETSRSTNERVETRATRRETTPPPSRPTWDSIHKMTWDELDALQEREGLNLEISSAKGEADLADWICEEMKIEKSAPASPELGERLRRFREGDR